MPDDEAAERPRSSSQNGKPPQKEQTVETPTNKPGLFNRVWTYTGLDGITIILMLKGALPPIICLAAYEADGWARKYTTLGYLSAIMSLLSMAIQPRAKFIQSMLISLLFVCVGAAMALLQIQCVVSARQTTSKPAGTVTGSSGSKQSVQYNSSASAVAAIFLFLTIYVANTVRAFRPQLMLPIIQYSIFTIVASSYAASFPDMAAGKSFVKRLFETFTTGFGIATGVSLFVVPMTSRTVASKQMGSLLGLMKASIGAHGAYMTTVSTMQHDGLGDLNDREKDGDANFNEKKKSYLDTASPELSAEAKAMQGLLTAIGGLYGKINLEIGFAKREIAYGKLAPEDFGHVFLLLREIVLPIFGMTTFIDIMQSVKNKKTDLRGMIDNNETVEAIRHLETDEWQEVMTLSHDDYMKLKGAMTAGLTHIGIVLEFEQRPKAPKKDEEHGALTSTPGDPAFADYFATTIQVFHEHREGVIRRWCEKKGVELPSTFWDDPEQHYSLKEDTKFDETLRQKMNHQQLYLILYIEYLMWSKGKAILEMIRYADSKVTDGTMTRKRLIVPAWHRLRNFWDHAFREVDSDDVMYDGDNAGTMVTVGDSLKQRKDPEHLPPANILQKSTDRIRSIPRLLGSPQSSFGFRTAVATLSIGVMAYVKQTHTFYLQERVLWAMIMVAISMSAHAGQGIFGFVARLFGTFVAMSASIILWYVGGQKPAAIIPLFYLYVCGGIWFLVKNPKLAIAGVISMVTAVLILGYELQERKIGLKVAVSNGQPYYKIYILAPYRLATVCAGLAVNFFWTYFPYPVTTHSTLRKDLGATLYLLANFYSCVHTTVDTRLRLGTTALPTDKSSPMARLDESRHKVFGKLVIMISRLREHSAFTKFEPTFGGKFPKDVYDDLIDRIQSMFNYMSLISYSSSTFSTDPDAEESGWLRDFRRFTSELNITSHELTSTLCLLSASVSNSQPLPPYLKTPKPFSVADRMSSVDPELLSVKHVSEPCYAAFAVLEVASSLITEEICHVVKRVQDLVGEVDFSFHVISTNDGSSTSSTLFDEKDAEKGKQA